MQINLLAVADGRSLPQLCCRPPASDGARSCSTQESRRRSCLQRMDSDHGALHAFLCIDGVYHVPCVPSCRRQLDYRVSSRAAQSVLGRSSNGHGRRVAWPPTRATRGTRRDVPRPRGGVYAGPRGSPPAAAPPGGAARVPRASHRKGLFYEKQYYECCVALTSRSCEGTSPAGATLHTTHTQHRTTRRAGTGPRAPGPAARDARATPRGTSPPPPQPPPPPARRAAGTGGEARPGSAQRLRPGRITTLTYNIACPAVRPFRCAFCPRSAVSFLLGEVGVCGADAP